jgi:hypothetical protein
VQNKNRNFSTVVDENGKPFFNNKLDDKITVETGG